MIIKTVSIDDRGFFVYRFFERFKRVRWRCSTTDTVCPMRVTTIYFHNSLTSCPTSTIMYQDRDSVLEDIYLQ